MKHTVRALLQDHAGALNRAVSLFRRHGYQIETLHVAASETPGTRVMTLVVEIDDVDKLTKQLDRLIDVLHVEVVNSTGEISNGETVLQR